MKRAQSIAPVLLAALLYGCSGPAVHFAFYATAYDGGEVRYANRDGALLVEAFAGPGGGDSAQLSQDIAALLTRSGPAWLATRYTADPADPEVDLLYRLRWLIDVPRSFPVTSACAADISAAAWTEQTGIVMAALCRKHEYLSMAQGAFGAAGPGNPDAFRRTVGMMARELMPLRNPDDRDDCHLLPSCG